MSNPLVVCQLAGIPCTQTDLEEVIAELERKEKMPPPSRPLPNLIGTMDE